MLNWDKMKMGHDHWSMVMNKTTHNIRLITSGYISCSAVLYRGCFKVVIKMRKDKEFRETLKHLGIYAHTDLRDSHLAYTLCLSHTPRTLQHEIFRREYQATMYYFVRLTNWLLMWVLLGKGAKKNNWKKNLTSVSFMYVCVAENGEMLVFFLRFFPPTIV